MSFACSAPRPTLRVRVRVCVCVYACVRLCVCALCACGGRWHMQVYHVLFGICMSKSRLSCVAVLSHSLGHVSYELGDFEHVLQ